MASSLPLFGSMNQWVPAELVRHVAESTGLPESTAARVAADVIAYFDESTEQYVRRRHGELQRRGCKNARIWAVITAELAQRPVASPELSERRLRRIVYG